eukprot:225730_1
MCSGSRKGMRNDGSARLTTAFGDCGSVVNDAHEPAVSSKRCELQRESQCSIDFTPSAATTGNSNLSTRELNAASSRWDLNNNKRRGEVSILFPAAKMMWDEPELGIEFSPDEETAPLCYRSTPSYTSDVSSTVTSHDCCSSEGNSPTTSFYVDCHSNFQQQQQQQLRSSFPPCNLKCEFYLRNDESRARKDAHLDYIDKWYSSREQYIFDTVFTDPYTPPRGECKIAEVVMEPNLFPYDCPPDIEHWTLWSQQDMTRDEIIIWVGESLRRRFPHVLSWNYDSNGGDRTIEWFHVHIYIKLCHVRRTRWYRTANQCVFELPQSVDEWRITGKHPRNWHVPHRRGVAWKCAVFGFTFTGENYSGEDFFCYSTSEPTIWQPFGNHLVTRCALFH